MTPDYAAIVNRYLAVWNTPDPGLRAKAVAELWTEDAAYTDPLADVRGHDGIGQVIAAARERFPGFVFTRGATLDGHGRLMRFTWGLGPEGGEPLVEGFDVAVLTEDGRIAQVLGFLDKVPAA
ncbi:nuclear transport factor 2 family protein [Thermostaphylospora chromogena]|uniref:SnoaL-like domain-containing protein n=1 Tax=Thermostaphylospora chromogena TaxID=35622 RepID=A0A1H1HMV8_9ACTN|nr:nuclear transport factor 2 family protein [Thermostaphylospora chromogena]SDR26679.1 SnoaL-like domain-containing protein [Thermostaphylospora chromogena]